MFPLMLIKEFIKYYSQGEVLKFGATVGYSIDVELQNDFNHPYIIRYGNIEEISTDLSNKIMGMKRSRSLDGIINSELKPRIFVEQMKQRIMGTRYNYYAISLEDLKHAILTIRDRTANTFELLAIGIGDSPDGFQATLEAIPMLAVRSLSREFLLC